MDELKDDLREALELLKVCGPNPILINESEYWDRYNELMDKYYVQDDIE